MKNTELTEGEQRRNKNLKPFKKGESGNPAGRPKGSLSLTELLRNMLLTVPEGEDKRSHAERFVSKIIDQANAGDSTAQKLVMNYIEGLPKQTFQVGVDKDSLGELTTFFRAVANQPQNEKTD